LVRDKKNGVSIRGWGIPETRKIKTQAAAGLCTLTEEIPATFWAKSHDLPPLPSSLTQRFRIDIT